MINHLFVIWKHVRTQVLKGQRRDNLLEIFKKHNEDYRVRINHGRSRKSYQRYVVVCRCEGFAVGQRALTFPCKSSNGTETGKPSRCFATLSLSKGVPIETISSVLGHTSIRTTQIYAKITNRKISEDMKLLAGRLCHLSERVEFFNNF